VIAKILVVDDNEEIRSMICDFLRGKGHEVLEASDGSQGFFKAENEKPHLVITDIVMPGVYGTTETKQFRQLREMRDMPVIIISGSAEERALGDLLEDPKVRFLKKPLALDVLEATINELLPEGGYTR